jgi:alkylhydroperoxidase/carboxymuconolactone decarboxylase family protein
LKFNKNLNGKHYLYFLSKKTKRMSKTYYDPADLRKFGNITEWNEELGNRFFDYYGKVFEEGALSAREKSLIALAVAHTEQCPYCIDAYTKDGLQRGVTKEEMMEAIHVGAAIKSGATLVHGVQMMNKVNKLEM